MGIIIDFDSDDTSDPIAILTTLKTDGVDIGAENQGSDDEGGDLLRLEFKDELTGKRVRYEYADFSVGEGLRLPRRRELFLDDAPILGQQLVAADALVDEDRADLDAADAAGLVHLLDQELGGGLRRHAASGQRSAVQRSLLRVRRGIGKLRRQALDRSHPRGRA